jgi:hypothetical protein
LARSSRASEICGGCFFEAANDSAIAALFAKSIMPRTRINPLAASRKCPALQSRKLRNQLGIIQQTSLVINGSMSMYTAERSRSERSYLTPDFEKALATQPAA